MEPIITLFRPVALCSYYRNLLAIALFFCDSSKMPRFVRNNEEQNTMKIYVHSNSHSPRDESFQHGLVSCRVLCKYNLGNDSLPLHRPHYKILWAYRWHFNWKLLNPPPPTRTTRKFLSHPRCRQSLTFHRLPNKRGNYNLIITTWLRFTGKGRTTWKWNCRSNVGSISVTGWNGGVITWTAM